MSDKEDFDSELQRIGGLLANMREASEAAGRILADAAERSVLPEEEQLAFEDGRLPEQARKRQAVEADLARLVSQLARQIARHKTDFDNRGQPTRIDRLVGLLSSAAKRRRITARSASLAALPRLEELLRRGDKLAGLLKVEREFLADERRKSEGDLLTIIDHRSEITATLRDEQDDPAARIAASAKVERTVQVFERFVEDINNRISACNVLLHKLSADMEDLLILYQVVFDISRSTDSVPFDAVRFPNLSSEIDRFSRGMLTIRGLDARRLRADDIFFERFATEAPAPETSAGATPAKGGWKLPALPGLKLSRS